MITSVTTKKTGPTILAAERRPAPITISPANTKIPKNGGPGRCSASGLGSGRACASTVLPVMSTPSIRHRAGPQGWRTRKVSAETCFGSFAPRSGVPRTRGNASPFQGRPRRDDHTSGNTIWLPKGCRTPDASGLLPRLRAGRPTARAAEVRPRAPCPLRSIDMRRVPVARYTAATPRARLARVASDARTRCSLRSQGSPPAIR